MPIPTSGQLSAREIFTAARAITDGRERDAFLQSQCGQDQQLRKIVSEMLAAPRAGANRPHRCAVVPLDVAGIDPHEAVANVLRCHLADAYRSLGTEPMFLKAIQVAEQAPGWNQNLLAWCHSGLAFVYAAQGRTAEALAANEKSLEVRRELLTEQPDVVAFRIWFVTENLRSGRLLQKCGRQEQALEPFRVALHESRRLNSDYSTFADGDQNFRSGILTLADKVVVQTGGNIGAFRERGSLYAAMEQYTAARDDFSSAVTAGNAGDVRYIMNATSWPFARSHSTISPAINRHAQN